MAIKVGVIGLGMMGNTHLDVYSGRDDVEVVAISDINPKRLNGEERAGGNVEGQAQGAFDISKVTKYDEGKKLIADKSIELVDICLPTPLHREFVEAALAAGKHVLTEKPVAPTFADAQAMAAAGDKASTYIMCAMCMRFWPGWDWLKEAIDKGTYGNVRSAHFQRVASHPGGPFYLDGDQCGGAILDLHVHDTDFVRYCFGLPESVFSTGYSKITNKVDHVMTQYIYPGGPMVTAEGGWSMADGFGFSMSYRVNFENATAVFDLAAGNQPLKLTDATGDTKPVDLPPGMGYEREIDYLINCIKSKNKPATVTLADAALGIRVYEAEIRSIASGNVEKV